jgi:hypothetical protein
MVGGLASCACSVIAFTFFGGGTWRYIASLRQVKRAIKGYRSKLSRRDAVRALDPRHHRLYVFGMQNATKPEAADLGHDLDLDRLAALDWFVVKAVLGVLVRSTTSATSACPTGALDDGERMRDQRPP